MLAPSVSALDWRHSTSAGAASKAALDDFVTSQAISPSMLALPPVADPAHYTSRHFDVYKGDHDGEHGITFAKGTTTLAFKFQGGIIVSVDSRSTQGPYIASQSVKKIIEINPYLLGTMAGGAADCAFWERDLGMRCRLHELRNKERISVAAASKLLANTLYSYRGYGLSVGTMIAGWDKTGPALYYVDNDGTRLQAKDTMPYFSVGSGSTYAYGVLDGGWKYDLTDDEAIDLGSRAIYHATYRDSYSGGTNNLYLVKPDGWKRIHSLDVQLLHAKYKGFPPAVARGGSSSSTTSSSSSNAAATTTSSSSSA